jgi:hypothetical protein
VTVNLGAHDKFYAAMVSKMAVIWEKTETIVNSSHTCIMFCVHFLTSKVLLSAYCTFIANSGVVFCGLNVCVCFYLGLSDHGRRAHNGT